MKYVVGFFVIPFVIMSYVILIIMLLFDIIIMFPWLSAKSDYKKITKWISDQMNKFDKTDA